MIWVSNVVLQTIEYSPFYSINFQQIFVILTFLNSVFLGGFFGIHIDIIWRKKYFSFQKCFFFAKKRNLQNKFKSKDIFFSCLFYFFTMETFTTHAKGVWTFLSKKCQMVPPKVSYSRKVNRSCVYTEYILKPVLSGRNL